jgi:hypothetical protein
MIVESPDWAELSPKPGEHVVVLNGDLFSAFYARAIGLDFRDTIVHLYPGGVETILVFRAPLDGTIAETALQHGTGGLHIDACRIGCPPGDRPDKVAPFKWGGNAYAQDEWSKNAPAYSFAHPGGRWPPNLVLSHAESCKRVGQRRVQSGNPGNQTESPTTQNAYGKYNQRSLVGHADEDNTELVDSWDCSPTCPVLALDEMSGLLTSGTGAVKRQSAAGFQGDAYGVESRPEGTPSICYGDTGTASRFFPQFQRRDELLAWLGALTG